MKNRKKRLFGIGLAVAALLAAGAMARGVESKNAPDFARERAALIGRIPPAPEGTLSFDATAMKPLVQDDPTFKMETDKPVAGMTTAWIGDARLSLRDPDNDGGYWKLAGIKQGKYFVGVWYGSGQAGAEAIARTAPCIYLNGRIVQLSTTSDPVQVAPGIYFAEAQTKEAVEVGEGDDIDVLSSRNVPIRVARLTLYPKEPLRGRNWAPENYGSNFFVRDSSLKMNLDCAFLAAPGKGVYEVHFRQVQGANLPEDLRKTTDGKQAVAQCRIANPLSVPLTVEYTAKVQAYFRETVGEDKATVKLGPHERITREIPFTIIPDSRRYTIEAHARVTDKPSLGWPEMDTISYFPGVRQETPWTDPFTAKDERSLQIAGALPGERTQFSLNGAWDTALTTSLTPPMPPAAGLEWRVRQIPVKSYQFPTDKLEPRPHGAYFRRNFNAPAREENKTYRLVIESVADEGTAYVNGQKVGNVRGGGTPLICDITKAVKAGDNEIMIVQRDMLAIMDPAYVNLAAPVLNNAFLDAPGGDSQSGFALSSVSIESSPAVAANGLLIMTSVRKKEINARFEVTNHEAAAAKLKVTGRVLDAGKEVLDVGSQEITLNAGQSMPVTFTKAWQDPALWGPGSAKLYTLAIETADAASGKRLDLLRERFGFRETWIEKDRVYFNGAPVRLKGSTCHGGSGVNGADDVQWSRGTYIPDFMDEFGYLVSFGLAAIFNSSSRHNVERDAFWESARQNILSGLALYGNHPCIIAWDLSNEWLSFLDYGGGDPIAGARRFKGLADALAAADPSRWCFFNGDEDLHGLHNTFSTHYMLDATNPGTISGYGFRGHSNYYPDGAFYRPLDRDFIAGEEICINYARKVIYRYGEKMLMNNENLWKVSGYMPPGPSKFAGEDDVLSPAIDSGRGPIAWMWKQNLDGHRDLGVTSVCSYTAVCGVARRAQMLQCFIMPNHTHHYFSGQTLERTYSLHNNLFVPSAYVFQWSLVDQNGKTVKEDRDSRKMASGDIQRGTFSFELPQVKERTLYTLKLELMADGRKAYGEQRDIEVWPDAAPGALRKRKIVLFDPAGATAKVFKKAAIPFETIDSLKAPEAGAVLVVAEGAIGEKAEGKGGKLGDFVAAGGRVVVLAQENLMPGLPVRTFIEKREWTSMPFVRTPQHPLVAGVSSWDLHFWSPEHVSARGAYSKPEYGPSVVLVDSGTDVGLEWAQMMECYQGKGSYILCQLPVAGKYETEPMARELLGRLLNYATGEELFRSPHEKLQVVAAEGSSPVVKRLQDSGVLCEAVQAEAPMAAGDVRLVDANGFGEELPIAACKTALKEGATLIVHGARPEHAKALSSLAERAVSIAVQPYGMWEGRAYRNGFTWLTPGLSHIDLYWKSYDGSEGAVAQAEDPKLKTEDIILWSASAEGETEHVFPGGLVEIPVGKGRLILDQVRWETSGNKLERLAMRVVSSMMIGLDVAVEPYVAPPSLPKDAVFKPIDLTAFANRGLADEVGEDGKGGWSDQGPKMDLHELPTGAQNFNGVPFMVGKEPHSCIVLSSTIRPFPELLPQEVNIPLGYAVEGLSFLHGLTYSGQGPSGLYEIQYADGTTHAVQLVGGENIHDWVSAPGNFPREKGTQSQLAWKGTTQLFADACVYQMLWVNPKPTTAVKAVRFTNTNRSTCPILIALTAAVKSDRAAPERTADQARAKELLQKALAALDANRDPEAKELAQQAIQADPTLEAAHQTLAQICEKLKDENAALAAYQAWVQAGAHSPLPYNRIGQVLESRKDYKGALAAYTKSLEVEWNQPPIIEAKKRMQGLVNQ